MNRFNQYVNTNYIGLPVDSYQMAMAASEQESQQKLDVSKMTIDAAHKIEAAYNPDKELKSALLSDMENQIKELSRGNMSAPQTLMKLNNIVNNPEMVDQLVAIQGNTAQYRSIMEAMKKYKDEYGNDINLAQGMDEITAYNKMGKSDFKSGFMSGYNPDKFVDVVGDVQKVLKDVKADVKDIQNVNGDWIVRTKTGDISLQKLLGISGAQMNDPKFATQLKHLMYYNARAIGGGDVKQGAANYHNSYLKNIDDNLPQLQSQLQKLQAANGKGKYNKQIEQVKSAITEYTDQRTKLAGMDDNAKQQFFQKNYLNDLSLMAAKPYEYEDYLRGIEANPYALARYKESLEFGSKMKLLKMLQPEDVEVPLWGGETNTYDNRQQVEFLQQFGDLPIKDGKAQLDVKQLTKPGVPGTFGGSGGTHSIVGKVEEWKKFADSMRKHGYQFDPALIEKRDDKTLRDLGNLYSKLKAGDVKYGGLGISLTGSLLDPQKVTGFLMDGITASSNVVTKYDARGNAKKVTLAEALGSGDNAEAQQALLLKLSNNTLSAVLNPNTNRIAISSPSGEDVFYITPDMKTQRFLQEHVNITNPTSNVSTASISLSRNGQVMQQPVISVGSIGDGSIRNRDVFVPKTDRMDPNSANQLITKHFGATLNVTGNLPKDGAYIIFKDTDGKSKYLNYDQYSRNKASFNTKYGFGQNKGELLVVRHNDGSIQVVDSPPPGVNSESILQEGMNTLINNGPLRWLLKDNKQTNDYIYKEIQSGIPTGLIR